ncbi:MAG TPA: hypothetical protein VN902_23535 [Candidatus Acidoferrales bacterium]|nr:hypothetical protein [Candidatus Acidoferrales bacterium]
MNVFEKIVAPVPTWDEAETDFDGTGDGDSIPEGSALFSGACKISGAYCRRTALAGDWDQRKHLDLQYREQAVTAPASFL